MEGFQKEYLINRIAAGYIRYPINKDIIKIYSPNIDVLYESSEIYVDTYNKAQKNGLMTDADIYAMLLDYGLWTEEQEIQLKTILPKHIEYWKIKLFNSVFKSQERETTRKYLQAAKKELEKLHLIRHSFDHATCAGVANYAKFQYIIEKSSIDSKGKLYNWKKSSPYLAMCYYQDNIILEDEIRELAHTSPWDNIWSAAKKNGAIFNRTGVELSADQQRLIIWSSMYDSIREAHDSPSDDVIADNDMLDGWLLLKKQEREKNNLESQADGLIKNSKIANSDEVYMKVNTLEDAKKLDMLNSEMGRNIKKRRFDLINQKGEVSEVHLPDIQQKLSMEVTQAMRAAAKGK